MCSIHVTSLVPEALQQLLYSVKFYTKDSPLAVLVGGCNKFLLVGKSILLLFISAESIFLQQVDNKRQMSAGFGKYCQQYIHERND